MALKSGEMGYLKVPATSYDLASKFLDKVETDEGLYGYVSIAETTSSTHAIGLLSRMYLGWKQDHPILVKGKEALSKTGPLAQDMYFNYYTTQILHQFRRQRMESME